ncbi:hypothetical protein F5148DRAFT_1307915 [Russula earlei]|uniref:Uncharacterized protein n=1 Tax=Russula earlei TaxID=71964 RepID=A0ACC0U9K7_9AGAM|nr:hypothetical protein F5148DRAFT_1307915 [Russula earlei]
MAVAAGDASNTADGARVGTMRLRWRWQLGAAELMAIGTAGANTGEAGLVLVLVAADDSACTVAGDRLVAWSSLPLLLLLLLPLLPLLLHPLLSLKICTQGADCIKVEQVYLHLTHAALELVQLFTPGTPHTLMTVPSSKAVERRVPVLFSVITEIGALCTWIICEMVRDFVEKSRTSPNAAPADED